MSMKREKAEYRMGTGATSMLMIFIVLCLTTLSILSFATARTDYSMTKRNVMMVGEYYGAVNQVQEIIAQIDAGIIPLRQAALEEARSEVEEAYAQYENVPREEIEEEILLLADQRYLEHIETLRIEGIQWAIEAGRYLVFTQDAEHDRQIKVALELSPPNEEPRLRIVQHNLIFIDNWEPDFGFELFQSSDIPSMDDMDTLDDLDDDEDYDYLDDLEMLD